MVLGEFQEHVFKRRVDGADFVELESRPNQGGSQTWHIFTRPNICENRFVLDPYERAARFRQKRAGTRRLIDLNAHQLRLAATERFQRAFE